MSAMDEAPAGTPGRLMRLEIDEQPAALRRLVNNGSQTIRAVSQAIRRRQPRFVLLAGRGTSDNAALYAKYLIEVRLGLPAGLVSLSTLTTYAAQPHMEDVLWIAVSQSGSSPDLVESTATARRTGALTLAVTNGSGSDLERVSELHLDVLAGPEAAVAATKTYTCQLLSLWMLIDGWAGGDGRAADAVPELAAEAVSSREVLEIAERYRFASSMIITGRGYGYPTAREAALKLMETSYLSAHAFSGADLMHGPVAMVDPARPVLVVLTPGAGGQAMEPVMRRLVERRADITVIGTPPADIRVPHVAAGIGTVEELSPVTQIIPLQNLAYALAVERHNNPDQPRGLQKVTRTR